MKTRNIILSIITFLIISLGIVFFLHDTNTANTNKQKEYERFSDVDNASPIYQNCIGTNNNCPLNKQKTLREETPDGYKIGDDHYTCMCKCSRKCNNSQT